MNCFVNDPMRNLVDGVFATLHSRFAAPYPLLNTTVASRATSTAPMNCRGTCAWTTWSIRAVSAVCAWAADAQRIAIAAATIFIGLSSLLAGRRRTLRAAARSARARGTRR